jgi:hypothetical protein
MGDMRFGDALVRQRLGADHHPAAGSWRDAADHGALLHAVGKVDPGKGYRPRYCVEAAKIDHPAGGADQKKTDSAESAEQGSVDPTIMGTPDDYQLERAVDMLRGIALFSGRVVNN